MSVYFLVSRLIFPFSFFHVVYRYAFRWCDWFYKGYKHSKIHHHIAHFLLLWTFIFHLEYSRDNMQHTKKPHKQKNPQTNKPKTTKPKTNNQTKPKTEETLLWSRSCREKHLEEHQLISFDLSLNVGTENDWKRQIFPQKKEISHSSGNTAEVSLNALSILHIM